jgi:hypothetical protein
MQRRHTRPIRQRHRMHHHPIRQPVQLQMTQQRAPRFHGSGSNACTRPPRWHRPHPPRHQQREVPQVRPPIHHHIPRPHQLTQQPSRRQLIQPERHAAVPDTSPDPDPAPPPQPPHPHLHAHRHPTQPRHQKPIRPRLPRAQPPHPPNQPIPPRSSQATRAYPRNTASASPLSIPPDYPSPRHPAPSRHAGRQNSAGKHLQKTYRTSPRAGILESQTNQPNRGLKHPDRLRRKRSCPITSPPRLLLAAALPLSLPAITQADIYQWEYIDPANPDNGTQPSTTLAPDGAGLIPEPASDLSPSQPYPSLPQRLRPLLSQPHVIKPHQRRSAVDRALPSHTGRG